MASLSIRSALVGAMLAIALVPALLVGAIGVSQISRSVRREAQSRVDQDLAIVQSAYADRLERLAEALTAAAGRVEPGAGGPPATLDRVRRELDLTLLRLCDAEGRPLDADTTGGGGALRTPLEQDAVLRQALGGHAAWGTVRLDPARLALEGGPALRAAAEVHAGGRGDPVISRDALFWWVACPLLDRSGRVVALLYGGRLLNGDETLVDDLRATVFGEPTAGAAPRGTVTLFLGDVRVATNVLTRAETRAVGTRVSGPVRARVLERGLNYTGEALVVDDWYLSAYAPLHDPAGKTIGMLYAGLQRRPYDELRDGLILRFLLPVSLVALLAVGAALYIAGRITRPVRALHHAAVAVAHGDLEHRAEMHSTYQELEELALVYLEMQEAIHRRDLELRARNEELAGTNLKLAESNRNYMQTLGFVTHELKAPLAAMQMIIATVLDGFTGDVPDAMGGMLQRVRRNCEELQDMVRDYLDLSRMERGELAARPAPTDLVKDVLEPAVDHTALFFRSRGISVTVEAPAALPVTADAELLRVALNNLLTNAAKYGREGGAARVTLARDGATIRLEVWNEGEGFPPEEAEHLFEKFFRLRNANTQRKRGSGVGLFTVRTIAELHGGHAVAESAPGAWALFRVSFPARAAEVMAAPVVSAPVSPGAAAATSADAPAAS